MICPCCRVNDNKEWPSLNLLECLSCGHIWQKTFKPFEYGHKYIDQGYLNKPTRDMAFLRLGIVGQYMTEDSLIDVGYGDGEFVRQAIKAGFDAKGFDIHADDMDIPTVSELPKYSKGRTFFDSLEHFPNLAYAMIGVSEFVFVTIPHTPEGNPEQVFNEWRHFKPDEHLHYFTPSSLARLFIRYNYSCIAMMNTEDLIRKNDKHKPNTMTYVFRWG